MSEPKTYIHGHSPPVLKAHAHRTAHAFTPYLLPHLTPTTHLLDIGCGPGTISADFAALCSAGHITCLDPSATALDAARHVFSSRSLTNASFVPAQVENLPFDDASFDVVHAHQVLIHTPDPLAGMREMRRVLKPGGVLATKDMVISSMAWFPRLPGMQVWRAAMEGSMALTGADPDTGARTKDVALRAGFARADVRCSVGSWCFSSEEDVRWWGGSVADRLAEGGELRGRVVEGGFLTGEEVDEGVRAWRAWVEEEGAWFGVMNGEIICVK